MVVLWVGSSTEEIGFKGGETTTEKQGGREDMSGSM